MAGLTSYTFCTLNGYYKGLNEDINWHRHGAEEQEYSEEGAQSGSTLLFGRVTYQMMESFWPTPQALEMMPEVAKGMNESNKLVVSNTLETVNWQNTRLLKEDWIDELSELKKTTDITLLGSGSILKQLTEAQLIDQFEIMIDPVAIGQGNTIFEGLQNQLNLELTELKQFKSGVVLFRYKPIYS